MAAYRIYEDIIGQIDTLNLGIEGAVYSSLIYLTTAWEGLRLQGDGTPG